MGGAEYKLAPCATLAHPRALRGVIDEAEREHLTRIYFDRVHDRSSLTYYNLLGHLAREKADGASWDIVERIGARVRAELGEGYTLINDFFSYRAQGLRLFPSWHQDGEYWLADDGTAPAGMACGGFNLWVLLAHERMNYSFDVLEVESNKWMYDALYARQYGLPDASHAPPRPLYRPAEFAQLSRARGLRAFVDAAEPRSPRVTNVPLEAGDALLLRQVELHRTDTHELPPDQWRLALGFMVRRSVEWRGTTRRGAAWRGARVATDLARELLSRRSHARALPRARAPAGAARRHVRARPQPGFAVRRRRCARAAGLARAAARV